MKLSLRSFVVRFFKITGISLALLLAFLFLAPYIFPNTISQKIKDWTNSSIKGELNFSRVRLSFFHHFPSLTFALYDFSLKGSAPFQSDTLIVADEIALGINLKALVFDKKIHINKIFLTNARINVEVDEKGRANYNVYQSKTDSLSKAGTDTASTSLRLEKIVIAKSHLKYNDRSVPLLIEAGGFNYTGNGDLSRDLFDLNSNFRIESFSFILDKSVYLRNKKFDADLVTKINTSSLSFLFEKNNLHINQLPVQFSGKMDFLRNGYDFDLSLKSDKSDLHDFVTALPPQYVEWLEKTKVSGIAELQASFKGLYIASENKMPSFTCNMKVRDGYVAYQQAPAPASNLFVDFNMRLPSLNTDSLRIDVDSISFNLEKDYLRANLHTVGLQSPFIAAHALVDMDLERLDRAVGIGLFTMKGKLNMKLDASGKYATGVVAKGLRGKKDTVIVSIPSYNMEAELRNGYFKLASLPEALHDIHLVAHAACPDHDYRKSTFRIDTVQALALSNYLRGSLHIASLSDLTGDANLKSDINLGDIKKFYPLDSLEIAGLLKLDIRAGGQYASQKKLFPALKAGISLSDASIQTKYYPHPIEKINIRADAEDAGGRLKDLQLTIDPASFQFEGKPFVVHAVFKDFDDLNYDVRARGELDLGRIYKVFSRQGVDITGYAKMDLALKGRQSDATNGRYDHLQNSGTMELTNLLVTHEYFPKPFLIKEGSFSFQQDKMWFNKFLARYGRSDLRLDGFLSNTINYFLSSSQKLSGNFNLDADFISVDEFASYSGSSVPASTSSTETGVVMIPSNLDLTIKASAKKISYNGLDIEHFAGGVLINNAQIQLTETGFSLIGAEVKMDGLYGNTSPVRAFFQYHLQAKDFDIHRAYKEVKLFHDLASAAGNCEGIVSLDYKLQGRLNGNMYPIYPSLAGGGTLSIKKVKVKGLKLLNVVSSQADKQELKDPDLSKIDIKSAIRNNIITVERFKFKTAGFRIRVEGQTSFDNKINFKMRIGLPPLGIIGIPVRATGNADNPQVKLGKSDKDELIEKEDDDSDAN